MRLHCLLFLLLLLFHRTWAETEGKWELWETPTHLSLRYRTPLVVLARGAWLRPSPTWGGQSAALRGCPPPHSTQRCLQVRAHCPAQHWCRDLGARAAMGLGALQAGLGCQGAPEGIVLQAPGEGLGPLWYCGPLPAVACLRGSCPGEKLLWVLLSRGAFCHSTRTPSNESREPGGTRGVPWAWGSLWCGARYILHFPSPPFS